MTLFRIILGIVLLVGGVAVIAYTLFSSFNIFTGEEPAPQIFTAEKSAVFPAEGIEGQIQQMINNQLKDILPASSIFGMLNLAAWSILAGILIFGGAQISGLGIKLIK
jgi:hypothetical protein